MILFRRAVFSVCSIAVVGCGFDSDGLASSSNSAGSLESTAGSDSSDGDSVSQSSTQSMTTAPTGDDSLSTASTGDSVTGVTTTNTTNTTSEPTESGVTETTSGDPGSSEASSGGGEQGTTSEGGGSTETGAVLPPFYADCDNDDECGDMGGDCLGFYRGMLLANVCYIPCDGGSCPAPSDGTAAATCNTNDDCVLDCSGGTDCPTGMSCYDIDVGGGTHIFRCAWPV